MTKPMPMRLMVEEIAFGRTFRLISAMPGVVSIDIDAESPKQKQTRSPKGSHAEGTSTACLILRALAAQPTGILTRKELEAAIVAGGKAKGTLNGQLSSTTKSGLTKLHSKGRHKITAKGRVYLKEECKAVSRG